MLKRFFTYLSLVAVLMLIVASGAVDIVAEVLADSPYVPDGDLTRPTEIPGYSEGLTAGGGDLKVLIVTGTNYVLGFLGLTALTAVIYAGFLYVAHFGNDDLTGKAKKIIIYVAMGIIVILLSYSIVNVLVSVFDEADTPGGGGRGGGNFIRGSISSGETLPTPIGTLFEVEGKDFVTPLITSIRQLGDLCPHTPIGLFVNHMGCAQNELIPDTDGDGIANLLDPDDDNDGTPDPTDTDIDGDGVLNVADQCADTLSFVVFKVSDLERDKLQSDRVTKEEYEQFIQGQAIRGEVRNTRTGCAEYQLLNDIDGDGVEDGDATETGATGDCDRDQDGLLDNETCLQQYRAHVQDPDNVALPQGVNQEIVIEDVIDDDDDNDQVLDFGISLSLDSREVLLRQITNNFDNLSQFIRFTCALLPQTRRVQEFCAVEYDESGAPQPTGKLIRMVDDLSSDLTLIDFETFNRHYQDFIALVKSFDRVDPVIEASTFEGFLPSQAGTFSIQFSAANSVDPHQEFCAIDDSNYYWFVNKNLDFSRGLDSLLRSFEDDGTTQVRYDGNAVFYTHPFTEPGVYNIQLLVTSACPYNTVNPSANEDADVDAAIAGIASARVSIYPPEAGLVVRINDVLVEGGQYRALAGTTAPFVFNLTQSSTSRGEFTSLVYNCDDGNGDQTLSGSQENWTFDCQYTADQSRSGALPRVNLRAADAGDGATRLIVINFVDTLAALDVLPGLEGDLNTTFTFDGSRSQANGGVSSYNWTVEEVDRTGTTQRVVDTLSGQTVNYRFPAIGRYRVRIQVFRPGQTTGTAESVFVSILGRPPIAAFDVTVPDPLHPAEVQFDGSLSLDPDDDTTVLQYAWRVDGRPLVPLAAAGTGATPATPNAFGAVFIDAGEKVNYEFKSVGEHTVELTVTHPLTGQTHTVTDDVTIDSLLGVGFTIDKPAAHVGDPITFDPEDNTGAVGYFWDFGDGVTLVGDTDAKVHKYPLQGRYEVTLSVEDGAGNTNEATRIVRVGLADEPVPVVKVSVGSIEQDQEESSCIEVTRRDSVLFDAGASINLKGERGGLAFLWKIEELEELIRTRNFTRIFKELTHGNCLEVDLTITDLLTDIEAEADTVSIDVVNIPPRITDLRYTVFSSDNLVTPVTVNVTANGVRDPDGQIVRYTWWYYEVGSGQTKIDTQITQEPRASFIIGPRNIEGLPSTYHFVVEIEDNDGGKVNSETLLGKSQPLEVINGVNNAPVAEFVTDRSSVKVGELVSFRSTTRDPLGRYIPSSAYKWDFDGDGEIERGVTGPEVTHRYTKPGEYRPRLKVLQNGLSSTYDMKILVRPDSKKPEAAFLFVQSGSRVKFINNSTVDPTLDDKTLSYAWDLDTTVDGDGNGDPDDDADSELPNPVFEYKGDRNISVALVVTDAVGNTDRVVRLIPFLKEREQGALGATKRARLKPILITNPPRNQVDGRVYIQPPFFDVVFNAKQSTGKIQEYRLDTNIFVDSDNDGIPDNDIDNKTHPSWKDGSSFKRTYKVEEGRIRARLTVVSIDNQLKSQVVDIVFADDQPVIGIEKLEDPDEILALLENVPVVSFQVSAPFAKPEEDLHFDASRTHFPEEEVSEYRWDFDGDGLVDEITFEPTVTHSFSQEGAHEVILEAVSSGGLQGEYSQTVFIRGGLLLPQAIFTYDLANNTLRFTDASSFDPSLDLGAVQYLWTFTRLDGGSVAEWTNWDQVDEFILGVREFGLPPLWVLNLIQLEDGGTDTGVLSRQVVLGSTSFVARFAEGTLFLDSQGNPYIGPLRFAEVNPLTSNAQEGFLPVALADGNEDGVLAVYDTGVNEDLSVSAPVYLVYNGVVHNAELYQLPFENLKAEEDEEADAEAAVVSEPVLLTAGQVQDNLTIFELNTFGGRYQLRGELDTVAQGEVLGVSSVQNPVKVFDTAGLYRVVLKVTDAVGETSEQSELIRIDEDLSVVEGTGLPGEGEEIEAPEGSEDPDIVPAPVVEPPDTSSESSGLSLIWWIFIVVMIVVVAVVAFIVLKTIRQRQEELSQQPLSRSDSTAAPPAAPATPAEPVQPEVVESVPTPTPPAPAQKAATPAAEPAPPAPPAPEAPAEPAPKKDDQDSSGGTPPAAPPSPPPSTPPAAGGDGPIPDWLKG